MQKLNDRGIQNALSSKLTYASVLITIALYSFADETFEMDPAELFNELEKKYKVKIPEENENKINAALILLTTDLPFTDADVFNMVVNSFSDGDLGIDSYGIEEPSMLEILWMLYESSVILNETDLECSEEVNEFINDIISKSQLNIDVEDLLDVDGSDQIFKDGSYYDSFIKLKKELLKIQFQDIGVDAKILEKLDA